MNADTASRSATARDEADKLFRRGPSPAVCRAMSRFWERLGDQPTAEIWRKAAEMPRSEGSA